MRALLLRLFVAVWLSAPVQWLLNSFLVQTVLREVIFRLIEQPLHRLQWRSIRNQKEQQTILAEREATNWRPVDRECFFGDLAVEGALPECLNGEFVRNGPNARFAPLGPLHLFDGDGMLHGLRIKDGKASYVNRWVRTARLEHEEKLGRPDFLNIGEMQGIVGVLKILVMRLKTMLQLVPQRSDVMGKRMFGTGQANTALEIHNKQLLALYEGDAPYIVRLLQDGQMETEGIQSYGGVLSHSVTAHPKVDAFTQELMLFGYNFVASPHVKYSVVSAQGQLLRTIPITIPQPVMMHDFAVTQNYSIFLDLPLVFDPKVMVKKNTLPFVFENRPSRFGILPRHAHSEAEIKWFSSLPCFVFHTVNAWEDNDTNEVVLMACRFATFDLSTFQGFYPTICEWRFNLSTGAVSQRLLPGCDALDFPRVHPDLIGRPTRFAYCVRVEKEKTTLLFNSVVKIDLVKGRIVGKIPFGNDTYGGECVFVPKHRLVGSSAASSKSTEDDGYLMTFTHNESTQVSAFMVWDANTMNSKPVARVELPKRVPYGFHGIFVSEASLRR